MPIRGDIRGDGKVFMQISEGREYWAPMEVFLKCNPGFYERLQEKNMRIEESKARKRKLSKGEIRERDGWVFVMNQKTAIGGEYWVSPEMFDRMFPDYFQRKAAYEKLKAGWASTAEDRAERRRKKAAVCAARKRAEDPEYCKRKAKESYERRKDDPLFKQRQKAASQRYYEKIKAANAVKRAAKKAEREKIESEKAEARFERNRIAAENRAKREAAKLLRKPPVRLTAEQRRERKRDDKRNYKHRRRARIAGQESRATPSEIREFMKKAKGICHYCRQKFEKLTIDHVVPIARGGSHTLDNLVFACHGCNSEKRDLDPIEFAGKFGRLLV